MALVTEDWSRSQFQKGVRALRAFQVSGVATEDEAAAAVPFQVLSTHPRDSRLVCGEPQVTRSFNLFDVVCEFSRLTLGSQPPDDDNLLNLPITWLWKAGNSSEPVDRDLDDRAILNSAGFPFSSNPNRQFGTLHLVAQLYESEYDVVKNINFRNKVNQFPVILPRGAGSVPKLLMRLDYYAPREEYTELSEVIPVEYVFEVREPRFTREIQGFVSPFDQRIMDQGDSGYYDDNGTIRHGRFVDGNDDFLSGVLLDGFGKPKDPSIKIKGNKTPVDNPRLANKYAAEGALEVATWLYYRDVDAIDFAGLDLF